LFGRCCREGGPNPNIHDSMHTIWMYVWLIHINSFKSKHHVSIHCNSYDFIMLIHFNTYEYILNPINSYIKIHINLYFKIHVNSC
jgi:hypothetical protein